LFAIRIEIAVEFTQHWNGCSIGRGEYARILCDDQKLFVGDDGPWWKSVIDAFQLPIGKVEAGGGRVVEDFDVGGVAHGRFVHDFIDDQRILWINDGAGVSHEKRGPDRGDQIPVQIVSG